MFNRILLKIKYEIHLLHKKIISLNNKITNYYFLTNSKFHIFAEKSNSINYTNIIYVFHENEIKI